MRRGFFFSWRIYSNFSECGGTAHLNVVAGRGEKKTKKKTPIFYDVPDIAYYLRPPTWPPYLVGHLECSMLTLFWSLPGIMGDGSTTYYEGLNRI
jgi:hypothetical protein